MEKSKLVDIEERSLRNNIVVKSNELIQASYAMTVSEQRLLLACISRIDSRKILEKDGVFTISVEEARDLFYGKKDQRHAYRDLQDASERLFERKVRIALPNNEELLTRFVQSVKFLPDKGAVELRFAFEIIPYISQLEQNFTQYRIKNIVQLTSSYAIRIYELIVSWAGQNQFFKEILIDDFRDLLMLEEKYRQFGHLKHFVILPAIKQINESTDFEIDIAFKKSRRAFKWIQIRFNRKEEAIQTDAVSKATREAKRLKNQTQKQKRLEAEALALQEESKKKAMEERRALMEKAWKIIPIKALYIDKNGGYWQKQSDETLFDGSLIFIDHKGINFNGLYIPNSERGLKSIFALQALNMIENGELKATAL